MTTASPTSHSPNYIEIASDIVAAYVSNNPVPAGELSQLISNIHGSLVQIAGGQTPAKEEKAVVPACSPKRSVTDDYLICLNDGERFKSLKRHLRSAYNLSPEQYRAMWGLPADYPMVAPNYAKARSELAKKMGLGSARRKNVPARGRRKDTAAAAA